MGALPSPAALVGLPTFQPGDSLRPTLPSLASTPSNPVGWPPAADSSATTTTQAWPVPAKVVKRILDLEFVDMSELLSEAWSTVEEESKCCHQRRPSRRAPISNILVWVECYSYMVAILASRYPDKTAQLMAYQRTIVHAHRSFVGDGWAIYDTCYRRKAAATKSLDWGQIDFTLYNETFAGRAKAIQRCRYCLSEFHSAASCPNAPQIPALSTRLPVERGSGQMKEVCRLYNARGGDRCSFTPCRYNHACSICMGRHPASTCPQAQPPPAKAPRQEPPQFRARK